MKEIRERERLYLNVYHFENSYVLRNDALKISYDPLYGQSSARCDHFCPTSERVKLLTSHRVWSKNDRIYLDLVRDPSTRRNMIAFPEFSNRLPWNSIEHITVFDSGSGKIRKRKTKRGGEWEVEGKSEKSRSFGWKLIKIFLNRELRQNSCFFIKTWEFNFLFLFLFYLFDICILYLVGKLQFEKWKIQINGISKNLPLENI